MRARVPASSANLGPGFDVLALALDLYLEVSVEAAPRLEVVTTGQGSELPADETHPAVRIAAEVAGTDRIRVGVHSDIPLGRGLGSSAALAVAAAAAAGADDPFAWGVRFDGHPENAAASAFGGLVAATMVDGGALWRRLALDPDLVFVAVIPERELLTADARRVLAPTVERSAAVFNLGRLPLLIAGLGDRQQLVPEAGDDRLHQEARATLFPESVAILSGLRRAGARTSFWSGAGTTLLAVCDRERADPVRTAAEELLSDAGLAGRVDLLEADREGITLSD
ncbi:MAG: homoserine kinase [Acidobacteriota bacterium]|nr:homoserine kinase [Acidobacteriota bacterium]